SLRIRNAPWFIHCLIVPNGCSTVSRRWSRMSGRCAMRAALSAWRHAPVRGSLSGMTIPSNPYRGFRFPREVIEHAVWLYHCFSLGVRDVELILAARGIVVSDESIREWGLRFGRIFANMLRQRRRQPGDKWSMDEVFIGIRGQPYYLWRAVA